MNISALDLNLFHVFQAVFEEGSTVLAARRLSVTQSAVSNALKRLRQNIGDPLFVRSGRGLVPTPRALLMHHSISQGMHHLSTALSQAFDPTTTERTFTIACSDHHQSVDMPRVARSVAEAMPRACLRVVSIDYLLAHDGLKSGQVDVCVAPQGVEFQGQRSQFLFKESAVLLVRKGHPLKKARVSLSRLAALGHIDVHLTLGRPGHGNRATSNKLDEIGFQRRIALIVPSFAAAAMAAAETDYVAWLPSRAASLYTKLLELRRISCPLPEMTIPCALVWHERTDSDAGCRFFRNLAQQVLKSC